jgi:hypothetical protein
MIWSRCLFSSGLARKTVLEFNSESPAFFPRKRLNSDLCQEGDAILLLFAGGLVGNSFGIKLSSWDQNTFFDEFSHPFIGNGEEILYALAVFLNDEMAEVK